MALPHLALALDIDTGTASRKALALVLAAFCDADGIVAYDPEKIAHYTNMTPRSLRDQLHTMRVRGFLEWRPGDTQIKLTLARPT